MKSNTTRRSAPITRSRLRRPTSKSTTTTDLPDCARAAPKAAVDVVLPTPPLPDVITRMFAIVPFLEGFGSRQFQDSTVSRPNPAGLRRGRDSIGQFGSCVEGERDAAFVGTRG